MNELRFFTWGDTAKQENINLKKKNSKKINKFYLADVTDDYLADKDLAALASAQNGEFVLALDSAL